MKAKDCTQYLFTGKKYIAMILIGWNRDTLRLVNN